jgi:hypothetical protein
MRPESVPDIAQLMSEAVAVVLIAAGGAVTSFLLTNLLAIRPLRRWLSTTSGERLPDVVHKRRSRIEECFDTIDQALERIEWSARLLSREAQKAR